MPQGTLYLIPTTLGDTNALEVLPLSVRKAVESIDHYIVENEKVARAAIKRIVPSKSQQALHFNLINKFTDAVDMGSFLQACYDGIDMGLMSDAGCPGIADPGAAIVSIAHQKNVKVVPLVGPSSILLAMMASGLNGQNFAFNGYLPIDKGERKAKIKSLEKLSRTNGQAQLFIETPYRNNQMLDALLATVSGECSICVAADLTLPTEFVLTLTANEWKKNKVDLHKRPTLFIIQNN